MSTIPYRNLFSGGAGILGVIGDGFEPGHSLEVKGNDSSVYVEIVNPDEVELQIERASVGTNLWTLTNEPILHNFYAFWSSGFIYRIRQFAASTTGIQVFVINDIQASDATIHSQVNQNTADINYLRQVPGNGILFQTIDW